MRILFALSLSGILYTYIGYPILIWMLARLRPRPWLAGQVTPSVSIVLAVHNGVSLLPRKIQHLLELDYSNIQEIIIVSDGSTDGTAELLNRRQHSPLKSIVFTEHRGKAVAVNAGMAAATAEVILFVDIRPEIAPGSIERLMGNFADSRVGCVCGNLALRRDGHDAVASVVGGFYWRYEQWIRTCEARYDSPVGVYGGFYAIRRELAVQHPDGTILDDMFQPLSIIRQGYRTVLDSAAVVFDAWPSKINGEFHRKVRTLAGNFQLLQLAPWTLTPQNRVLFQLVSHKLMRLLAPYLILSSRGSIYAVLAAVQICGLALAVAGLHCRSPLVNRIAAPASAILVLNVAAVVALYKFLFTPGQLWKIWNVSRESARNSPFAERDLSDVADTP
jgi:glycosyltransferase involved in cell wall biosynthesis